MSVALRVGLLIGVWMLLVSAGFVIRVVDRGENGPATIPATGSDRAPAYMNERFDHAPRPDATGDEEDVSIDLYGNAVTAAVAKYKLDSTGSLYELHSPQTELPRLGPPKS